MVKIFQKNNNFQAVFIVLLPLVGSFFLIRVLLKANFLPELFFGWCVAIIFSFTGLIIKMRSIGKKIKAFFLYAFIFNTINIVLFLSCVVFVINTFHFSTQPFVLSVFVTYFVLTFYNIVRIRKTGMLVNRGI